MTKRINSKDPKGQNNMELKKLLELMTGKKAKVMKWKWTQEQLEQLKKDK